MVATRNTPPNPNSVAAISGGGGAVPTPSTGTKEAKCTSDKKDSKEKKVRESFVKRWSNKRKSKSPPPTASFYCDNPSFVDGNGTVHNVVLSNPGTSSLATIHVRSGSCPSEALNGSSHRKENETARGKQPAAIPLLRERFRCCVPYPPNSDYELELHEGLFKLISVSPALLIHVSSLTR